jgi:hypothetical protein
MSSDVQYFSGRASEERAAAAKATHPQASMAHLELAERYEELASAILERERHWGLHLSDVA